MLLNRLASLALAAGYVIVAGIGLFSPAGGMVTFVLAVFLPLPFIWFCEPLGDFVGGPAWIGYVNRPTSGIVLAVAGWMILIGVPLCLLLYGG